MQDMLHLQQQHQPQQLAQAPEDSRRIYSQFLKRNPLTFTGGPNVMESQYWIDELEKIFQSFQCSDEQQVILATRMLKGEADIWLRNARAPMLTQSTPLSWADFRWLFLGQFFPAMARAEKEAKLLSLKQKDMNVGQYTGKFEELSQFYLLARHAPDKQWKIGRYEQGLSEDISHGLGSVSCASYADLVQQAYVAERKLDRLYASRREHGFGNKPVGAQSS